MSELNTYRKKYLPRLSDEILYFINSQIPNNGINLRDIFHYHLGLENDTPDRGKRIRPFLLLICNEGAGGNWEKALPAAVAVELLHNFSLIHDDIEDNGKFRRGKEAVWVRWGLAKGLNAGDAMFASSLKSMSQLKKSYSGGVNLRALNLFGETCMKLTLGQQMDLEYEDRDLINESEYYEMVRGKTAALLSCCTEMGALLAGLGSNQRKTFRQFGENLGVAFQIYDDWLGIWGDTKVTGKSARSDLTEGKKSLPVILGLAESGRFADVWRERNFKPDSIKVMSQILLNEGVEKIIKARFEHFNKKALFYLEKMDCITEIKKVLMEFSMKLLTRVK